MATRPDRAPGRKPPGKVALKHLYVIELDREVLAVKRFRDANPGYRAGWPCVYVGQTGLSPEVRFEQHKRGIKANRYARKFGLRLRQPMTGNLLPVPWTRADAAERRLAEKLHARGCAVWQN
jgi:hypothetical protein